jgi:acetolactate synthase-1/2/3 large subunit
MHNLLRYRQPALLMAGTAPYSQRGELAGSRDNWVHYIQDVRDMPAIVRPYTKWEGALPSGVVAKEMLRRAHSVAHSDPPGPVYLNLPREPLSEQVDDAAVAAFPADRYGPVRLGGLDDDTVKLLADRLIAAESPAIITAYAGRDPACPPLLDALAQLAGIRVYESGPVYLNVPRDAPCFMGFAPGPDLARTDFGLLVDIDVPWLLKDHAVAPSSFWAHVDIDPVKQTFPMWDFPAQLRVAARSAKALQQLVDAVRARADAAFQQRVQRRMAGMSARSAALQQAFADAAESRGKAGEIAPAFVCAEVARAIGRDAVVVNEATRNAPTVLAQVPRTQPGTYVGIGGGGLGYSGGVALGMKLADRSRRVVQIVGDGSFYFSTPLAVYAAAKQYGLPILTVVLDNAGWAAVKEATLRMYPDGVAAARRSYQAQLAERIELHKVAEAAGAYGETVEEPDEVGAGLARCLAALDEGRSAVLVARVTRL